MRATTSLPRRSSMSVIKTFAPARARVSEQASPMPDPPPVTMAALPLSDIVTNPPVLGPIWHLEVQGYPPHIDRVGNGQRQGGRNHEYISLAGGSRRRRF